MKLLIVDDEKLTREGLGGNIDWGELNINEILYADDGIHGWEIVQMHRPDIIISDVRMPRMDGITMAEKVLEKYPETSIIFMSGYSDKEYLMAAIKLNVICYVEKPIDENEIKKAVVEAVKKTEYMRKAKNVEIFQRQEKSVRLALSLIQEINNPEHIDNIIQDLRLQIAEKAYFITGIVEMLKPISAIDESIIRDTMQKMKAIAHSYHLDFLYAQKHSQYIIIHFYSNYENIGINVQRCMKQLGEEIQKFTDYFAAVGSEVNNINKVYQSYNDAVVLLQSSFFYKKNTILRPDQTIRSPGLDQSVLENLMEAFHTMDYEMAKKYSDKMLKGLTGCRDMLPCNVKDIYYKCFIQLENTFYKKQILYDINLGNMSIWEKISACKTLYEVHEMFISQMEYFFSQLSREKEENVLVYQMKEYIHKNLCKETLSVKGISEYVHLSFSYACTLFKEETGKTINQYITECRMNLATHMLENAKYTMEEIAVRVGYNDGNYFGKVFKKMKGLSPSDFREKITR